MIGNPNRKAAQPKFDWILTILVFLLAAFGVFSVTVATYGASSEASAGILNNIINSYYGMRQSIFLIISPIIIGFIVVVFPADFFHRFAKWLYLLSVILLLITLGSKAVSGVKGWIDMLWGYTIQPAEFIKLTCIIMTAKFLENENAPLSHFKSTMQIGLLVGIPWAITVFQGEMGSVIVMVFVFAVMMWFGGMKYRHMGVAIVLVAAGLLVLIIYWKSIDSYRLERIMSFIDPTGAESGSAYQVTNSKIAIGSGGLNGKGVFVNGSFSQLDYVPEDWTDFIFSTIGEAFGFWGCLFVLLLYLCIIIRMLYLAAYTSDRFGFMIIIGVMAMLVFHVIENIGMTIGLMPVTGIPLPFLSYGGSNLVTNMIGIGLVLHTVRHRKLNNIAPKWSPITQ